MSEILNTVSEEATRFYERTMRPPEVVFVGLREWSQIDSDPMFRGSSRIFVYHGGGQAEVLLMANVWSMVAPAIREQP